jgi:Dolichyl-phosphate-mannose-protein mannosyltransferase
MNSQPFATSARRSDPILFAGKLGLNGRWLIAITFRLLIGGLWAIGLELREHIRLDTVFLVIVLVFLVAFAPIIPHATQNAQILTCCFDDEAPLTMALDGMRFWPYGDPFNLLQSTLYDTPEVPSYWGALRYGGFWYYGGTYLDLGILFYGPAYLVGLPPFPTAPIILRMISAVMALLSLSIVYNFGRRHAGAIAGTIAALFLLTDPYFVSYAAHIHPDTTELTIGLLALCVGVRYLERGNMCSLVALGLLTGLVQGTKSGGAWLIPMAALSIIVGQRRLAPRMALIPTTVQVLWHGFLASGFALFAYMVSTPYAFLKPDFFITLRAIWRNINTSSMVPVSYATWLSALWDYHGLTLATVAAALALVIVQALRGSVRWPMILAFVLGSTQLVWFSYNGRSWVVLGYMLGLFAVLGLVLGDLAQTVFGQLRRVAQAPAIGFAAVILVVLIGTRWYGLAGLPLEYLLTQTRTLIEIGNWAEAGNLPPDARILWDDSVYLDPEKFHHAKMNGHLISYNDLYKFSPEYVIISSHMYDAPHYAEMRKTQQFMMQNEGPISLRLYQDLLATEQPGPTRVPGVTYLRSFSETLDRRENCPLRRDGDAPYRPWLGAETPAVAAEMASRLVGGSSFGGWLGGHLNVQLTLLNHAGHMLDALRGLVCINRGPTLRLYRIAAPGTLNGFSQPFASSARPEFPALAAFDGEPSAWMPENNDTVNSVIGFDFGAGGDREFGSVRVDWSGSMAAGMKIEFQYGDFGGAWQSAGLFEVETRSLDDLSVSEHNLAESLGSHRLWRLVVRDIPDSATVGIREVRFMAKGPS